METGAFTSSRPRCFPSRLCPLYEPDSDRFERPIREVTTRMTPDKAFWRFLRSLGWAVHVGERPETEMASGFE
jgi:hypothetical protein